MKRIFTLLICISSFGAFAQNLDSLTQVLPNLSGQEEVDVLYQLCRSYAFADAKLADKYCNECLDKARLIDDTYHESNSLNALGISVQYQSLVDSAGAYFEQALEVAKGAQDSMTMKKITGNIGLNYRKLGDYTTALEHYYQALEWAQVLQDSNHQGNLYNDIGNTYLFMEDWDEGLRLQHKALEIHRAQNNTRGLGSSYNSIGYAFDAKNAHDSASFYYELALELKKEAGDPYGISVTLQNLCGQYENGDRWEDCKDCNEELLEYQRELNQLEGICMTYINLGNALAKLGDLNTSIDYDQKAWDLADSIKDLRLVTKAMQSKAISLGEIGRHKEGFELYREFRLLNDSLFQVDRAEQIAEMRTEFEVAEKERDLALSRAETAEADAAFQRSRLVNYISIGGIVALLIIALLLIARQREKQKAALNEAEVEYQQQLVSEREKGLKAVFEATEKERQRIAKDLHDGIGQQLSGIKLSLSNLLGKVPEPERPAMNKLTEVVDQTAQDVRTISHQMMPRALQELGLVNAIDDMLSKSLSMTKLKYAFEHFHVEGKRFNRQMEIGLYRICQELVNNIIKHASAKEVVVQLFENRKSLILIVEDDGSGFDPEKKKDGIGLTNIASRLNTINGEVNWEPSPQSGTTATIRIPID